MTTVYSNQDNLSVLCVVFSLGILCGFDFFTTKA